MWQEINIQRKLLYISSFILVMILFIVSALFSFGYEDDFYSAFMVEKLNSITEIIKYSNSNDFHPAGMYIINYILLKIFGSWQFVRTVGAFVVGALIWIYWYIVSRNITNRLVFIFSYIAICLNPSVLLWCTGLRWYTYLLPLVCIIAILIHTAENTRIKSSSFWGIYFIVCLLMFHINYLSAVIIITSFACLLYRRRKFLHSDMKYVIVYGVIASCLVSYQAFIFLTVHHINSGQHFWPLKFSMGAAMNFLSGSAVIPVSIFGIILIIANLILILAFFRNIKTICSDCGNNFFTVSYALIMLLYPVGTDKVRNFTILSPEMGLFLTNIYQTLRSSLLKIIILIFYIVASAGGIYNVITHSNTVKTTYNMPYQEILNYSESLDPKRKSLFVTNLTGLYFYAREKFDNALLVPEAFSKTEVFAPFFRDWYDTMKNFNGTIIAVRTHKGLSLAEDFNKFVSYLETEKVIEAKNIGYDKFAWFKQKFYQDYLEYYAQVFFIDNRKNEDE